eukprot:s1695_g9.t1
MWILKMCGSISRSIGGSLEKLPVSDEPIRPKWRTGRSVLVRQDCLFCQSSVRQQLKLDGASDTGPDITDFGPRPLPWGSVDHGLCLGQPNHTMMCRGPEVAFK